MTSLLTVATLAALLGACAADVHEVALAPARPGALATGCPELAARLANAGATFASELVSAGDVRVAGVPVPAHCRITGRVRERISPVDGQRYAIGFEMRLPLAWNGRFYYQANGGVDGSVVPAMGLATIGPGSASALVQGFAVMSSDAG